MIKTDHDFIRKVTENLCATYADKIASNHSSETHLNLPRESEIVDVLKRILELIFPGFIQDEAHSCKNRKKETMENIAGIYASLYDLILRSFHCTCAMKKAGKKCDCGKTKQKKSCNCHILSDEAARGLLEALPGIREVMKTDIQAAFDGDPAAKSPDEVVLSYPGLKAITIQRVAHFLYGKKIPLIPRMMGEYAHRITGIDIHPGAQLGKSFFIDHGTGVVIGETAEIGSGVKIYQGVTLGALSFPKDACGLIIKGEKRHPTIEDDVTIYAGATILGAVVIGKGSVIGGNVWLTEGTEPGTRVTIAQPELHIKKKTEMKKKS